MRPFQTFFGLEAASGILLLVATFIALMWSNSSFGPSYQLLWQVSMGPLSLHQWVNEGLMTVFFLLVGLEIKRELLSGELATRARATLPVAGALGGMIVPAVIHTAFNLGTPGAIGWGIPMATDIAFAVGILVILGKRIPPGLKVFLTALAIVDDLGAVLVIALFYSERLAGFFLGSAIGAMACLAWLNRLRIRSLPLYFVFGALLWALVLESGVHATIAGVLFAFLIPSEAGLRLERKLHPWVAFGIMPLFALANAGVSLKSESVLSSGIHPISLGVFWGLVAGKPVGIALFSWIAVQLKLARLPTRVAWSHLCGVACLGGIGFTMSLFVTQMAFGDSPSSVLAKWGILSGSLVSGVMGATLLAVIPRGRA